MIVAFIHAGLPFFYRLICDIIYHKSDNFNRYKNIPFWYYTLALFYVNAQTFYFNLAFLEIGVIDLKRRMLMMKVVNTIIEPNHNKRKGFLKIYPLINMFDPRSLLTWMEMRLII